MSGRHHRVERFDPDAVQAVGTGHRGFPAVAGRCPACGSTGTLFVASGGWVTCSYIPCSNPTAWANAMDPDAADPDAARAALAASGATEEPGDVTADEMATALNTAWAEFVGDTGCYPDAIEREGRDRLTADFGRGNFAWMVASWLNTRRRRASGATEEPDDDGLIGVNTAEVLRRRRASGVRPAEPEPTWCVDETCGQWQAHPPHGGAS